MLQPYIDTVRQEKTQRLKNINKKTKKHIPPYIFQAHANLLDKFPDAGKFLTPAFVYNTLRELTKAAEAQLITDKTVSIEMFGFGKFELVLTKTQQFEMKEQLHLKYRPSLIMLYRIRRHYGTATQAQLTTLERGEKYMAELHEKRLKFLAARELKNKGQLEESNPENYAVQFADILQTSLD